jgi:hypothetical protein
MWHEIGVVRSEYLNTVRAKWRERKHRGISLSALVVEVFLASILLPVAIAAIVATNTDGWDATASTFWVTYLPIILVVAVVVSIVYPIIPRSA